MDEAKTVEKLQEELKELKSTLVIVFTAFTLFGLCVLIGWAVWGS